MYVSAVYAPEDPTLPPGMPRKIIATDTEGREWQLTNDSQVGDWLEFIEKGGIVKEPEPGSPA